jgi:hypothetical protein
MVGGKLVIGRFGSDSANVAIIVLSSAGKVITFGDYRSQAPYNASIQGHQFVCVSLILALMYRARITYFVRKKRKKKYWARRVLTFRFIVAKCQASARSIDHLMEYRRDPIHQFDAAHFPLSN